MSRSDDCCRLKRKVAGDDLRHHSSHKKTATISPQHRYMTVESKQPGTDSPTRPASLRFASQTETAQAPTGAPSNSGYHEDVSPSPISKPKPPCLRIIVEFLLSIKNEPCGSQEIRGADVIQSRMFRESSVASTLSIHAKQGVPPIFEKKERRQGNGSGYMWTLNPDAQDRLCALYPDLEDEIREVLCDVSIAKASTNATAEHDVTEVDTDQKHGSVAPRGARYLGPSPPPLSPYSLQYQTTSPASGGSPRTPWTYPSEERCNRNTSRGTDVATPTEEYIHRDDCASDHSTASVAGGRLYSTNHVDESNEADGYGQPSAPHNSRNLDRTETNVRVNETSGMAEDSGGSAADDEPSSHEQAQRPFGSTAPQISGSALEANEYVERFACTLHRSRVWRDLPCHAEPDPRLVKHVVVLLKAFDDCCRAGEDQLIEDFSINTDFIDAGEPLDNETVFGSTIDETILMKTRTSIQDYSGLREAVDRIGELDGMALIGKANMKLLDSVKGLIEGVHERTGELLQMVQDQCMVSQLDLAAVQREKVTQGRHIETWVRRNITSPQSVDQPSM